MTFSFPFENLPMRGQGDIEGGGSHLLFSHPLINNNKPLIVHTGANSVQWGYGVNTRRIPTYGGEVVQILSMYADSLKIKGFCRNYKEQEEIYDFFLRYIKLAGGMGAMGNDNERNQTPITFAYPARKWTFEIMVTNLDDKRMALDVVAPEWGITAEIVSENDRYELGDALLTGMHQVLLDQALIKNKNTSGVIGYDPANKYSQDLGLVNTDEFATQIDERLQAQIASWATGDFANYVFNRIVGENSDSSFKSATEYWQSIYGTDVAFIVDNSYVLGNGDVPGLSSLSGVLAPDYVAAIAAEGFKKAGYPNLAKNRKWLIEAVRVSSGESSWNTQAVNWNYSGTNQSNYPYDTYVQQDSRKIPKPTESSEGNFDLGLFQINNYWHADDILKANGKTPTSDEEDRRSIAEQNLNITLFDPVINATVMAYNLSGKWNNWGFWVAHPFNKSHKPGGYERSKAQAEDGVDKYLANPDYYSGALSGGLSGSQANKIRQISDFLIQNSSNIYYTQKPSSGQGDINNRSLILSMSWEEAKANIKDPKKGLWGDCSSMAKAIYRWAGVPIPSGFGDATKTQVGACQRITNPKDVRPGDLVYFFDNVDNGEIKAENSSHVEIVLEVLANGTKFKTFSHGGDGDDTNMSGDRLDGARATNVSPKYGEVPRINADRLEGFFRLGEGASNTFEETTTNPGDDTAMIPSPPTSPNGIPTPAIQIGPILSRGTVQFVFTWSDGEGYFIEGKRSGGAWERDTDSNWFRNETGTQSPIRISIEGGKFGAGSGTHSVQMRLTERGVSGRTAAGPAITLSWSNGPR